MAKVIRVLVADDHALLRAGLAKILGAEPDIRIVGEARDGLEACRSTGNGLVKEEIDQALQRN